MFIRVWKCGSVSIVASTARKILKWYWFPCTWTGERFSCQAAWHLNARHSCRHCLALKSIQVLSDIEWFPRPWLASGSPSSTSKCWALSSHPLILVAFPLLDFLSLASLGPVTTASSYSSYPITVFSHELDSARVRVMFKSLFLL